MSQKYFFTELDAATQQYLLTVRDKRGAGMPGVFVPQSNYLPLVGLITGIVIVGATAWWTLPSLEDPMKTALLQTAGFLLGGWLIVAAFRVWMTASGDRSLGHFVYLDPLNLYEASGSSVKVTNLNGLEGAAVTDNHHDGKYQNTTVTLALPGRPHSFNVSTQAAGEQLAAYCNALAFLRQSDDSRVSNAPAPATGRMVRGMAGLDLEDTPGEQELTSLPIPQRVGKPPSGLLACLVIVAVAAVMVFALRAVNVVLRDDAIFEMVKNERPPLLRSYLVDPRNTRHRQEVERILAQHYAPVLARLSQQAQDKELGNRLVALVEALKTTAYPVASIRVQELAADDPQAPAFAPNQMAEREQAVQKQLVEILSGTIGDDLIAFVQPPPDVPPLVEITYRFVPEPDVPRIYRVEWTVRFRSSPDEKADGKTWTSQRTWNEFDLRGAVDEEVRQTLLKLVGQVDAPPPPPIVLPDGGF